MYVCPRIYLALGRDKGNSEVVCKQHKTCQVFGNLTGLVSFSKKIASLYF